MLISPKNSLRGTPCLQNQAQTPSCDSPMFFTWVLVHMSSYNASYAPKHICINEQKHDQRMTEVQSMQPPCRICASMEADRLRDADEDFTLTDDAQPFRFKPYDTTYLSRIGIRPRKRSTSNGI